MNIKTLIKKQYRIIMRYIPDKAAMQIDYLRGYRRLLNLDNPKTFGEKIQWIKLNGNLKKYSDLVDKYKVRNFISDKIGEEYLPILYGVYKNFNDINFDNLPDRFVLKCNHGCGYNIICHDKSKFNFNDARKRLNKWLSEDFSKEAKEIQYKNIKPVIICEEYLEDSEGSLIDYKYFCFNGKAKFIQVISDREREPRANFYDLQWNLINLRSKLRNSNKNFTKPKNLLKMNELAEKLSEGYPFVRVDFYNINGRIIFGELTFTPGGGVSKFQPIEKDYEIAKMIDLRKYKIS